MLKKLRIYIFSLFALIALGSCQTVTDKIDKTSELEKKELSKWLNKSEDSLKSFYGQPDKVEFLKTRNRNYVYITEKFKIKCERKFEINSKTVLANKTNNNIFRIYFKFSFTLYLVFFRKVNIIPISSF